MASNVAELIGNTPLLRLNRPGIGLTMVAAARGYKTAFVTRSFSERYLSTVSYQHLEV